MPATDITTEASIFIHEGFLNINYGDGLNIAIDLGIQEQEAVKQILSTGDFWTAFLGGLSAAVDQVKETVSE